MYQIKFPIGLKQKLGFIGNSDKMLRLSLMNNGYNFVYRHKNGSVFSYRDIPKHNINDQFVLLEKDSFMFLPKQSLLCLKTMDVTEHV